MRDDFGGGRDGRRQVRLYKEVPSCSARGALGTSSDQGVDRTRRVCRRTGRTRLATWHLVWFDCILEVKTRRCSLIDEVCGLKSYPNQNTAQNVHVHQQFPGNFLDSPQGVRFTRLRVPSWV